MKARRREGKRELVSSVFLISIICIFLTSIITIAHAKTKEAGIVYVAPIPPGTEFSEVGKEVLVVLGEWYNVEVRFLPDEFTVGEDVEVNIAEDGWTRTVPVQNGGTEKGKYIGPMDWYCDPELLSYCNTYTVKYRAEDGDPTGSYVAQGAIQGVIVPGGGHLHAIPEYAFGTVMAILSLFSGLGIYTKLRKK
jgi:hypothetical protein